MINNRVFTEEDKKLRPKVFVQDTEPNTLEDNIFFKVKSEETSGLETNIQTSLEITKDGKSMKVNVETRDDLVVMKEDGNTLEETIKEIRGDVIDEVLLSVNWVPDTDVPYIYTLNYVVPLDKDIEIYLNSSDPEVINQCAKANIISGKHNEGNIELIAYGIKPSVDIPIKLSIVKRKDKNTVYTLPPSTAQTLCGVKQGEGFTVDTIAQLSPSDIKTLLDEISDVSK